MVEVSRNSMCLNIYFGIEENEKKRIFFLKKFVGVERKGGCIQKNIYFDRQIAFVTRLQKTLFSKTLSLLHSLFSLSVAMALDDDIESVLFSEEQISERVSELASQIDVAFNNSTASPVIVGVATGAFLFLADLVRKIKIHVVVDFIRSESYGSGTESNGAPRISFDLKIDIQGKHVILVSFTIKLILTVPNFVPEYMNLRIVFCF